jgi:hypothetical protein
LGAYQQLAIPPYRVEELKEDITYVVESIIKVTLAGIIRNLKFFFLQIVRLLDPRGSHIE